MSTELTRALVRELYDAYRAGDMPRLADLLDPDVTFTIVGPSEHLPFYGTWRGREAAVTALETIAELFEPQSYSVLDLLADGDRAAARALAVFRHRASARIVELEIAHFLKMEKGRIVELRELHDTLSAHCDTFGLDVAALIPTRSV